MATRTVTRGDVQELIERLRSRATSALLDDMPSTQSDLRLAASILQIVLERGMPVTHFHIEVSNNG
jgi:hypothetical protein